MFKNINDLNDWKRIIYLFIIPGVFIVAATKLFIQVVQQDYTVEFYVSIIFCCFFVAGWFMTYRNWKLKVVEYLMFTLFFIYYLFTLIIEIVNSIDLGGNQTLSTFIIWTPLVIMFIFMSMEKKWALLTSANLLILSIVPGLMVYGKLTTEFKDSLIQLYISTAVYIVVFSFAHRLIQAHAEVDVMRRQFYLDSLTQVANRYQIDEWMTSFIDGKWEDRELSIIFFDIDYFKNVNDTYGHKVGDDVLREVARLVKSEMTEDHYFGRWGGEEFMVLAPVLECEAFHVAERLRKVIEDHNFDEVGNITASFGVTGYVAEDTVDTILVRADKRLYSSKEDGRNRVTGRTLSGI
ncbi:GGDEF domain-containing protein [Sporosarcina sp. BP05]|uniref:GGDEF domain-containing protein n=1 Tax=Sporosarcina sp. BP05 TaxID=2758726 RepID=UPI00164668B6|nr:GGDEF domain-containing protein [Sporosarcina sp. BP05]